jgi:hypothetical protein
MSFANTAKPAIHSQRDNRRLSDRWRRTLSEGKPFGSEIVVSEGIGLIGVIEQNKPPGPAAGLRAFGRDAEFGVGGPNRPEVVGDLFFAGQLRPP